MNGTHTTNGGQIPQEVWDALYLMACALHGGQPQEAGASGMDLRNIHQFSRRHGIEAMVFMALEGSAALKAADPELARQWKEEKEKAIRKNMLLDAERQQIFQEMDQAGIWHMPLKGVILQQMYPRYGMRQMADNDILYDPACQQEVEKLMVRRGYALEDAKTSVHDVCYLKEPLYNFEMHVMLFEPKESPRWHEYYHGIGDRLLREPSPSYGRRFTDEDFYLYMTAHSCKHYRNMGVGVRAMADTYLFIWKKKDSMDWEYLDRELEKLGIKEFEEQFRQISMKLFRDTKKLQENAFTKEERQMLAFCAGSGAYGTPQNFVECRMQEFQLKEEGVTFMGKMKYLRKRLFPDMEWLRRNEPEIAKHRWLIPFFLLYRIFRHLLFQPKWVRQELGILREMGKKKEPRKETQKGSRRQ